MKEYVKKLKTTANFIKEKINFTPDVAIVLGSGLGPLVEQLTDIIEIDYSDIPNFPKPTVEGHDGKLVAGKIGDKKVLAMKGRFHYYEGHDISTVVLGIRVFKMIGIDNLIVTNSAGGVNKSFNPGDLMIINDHIGFNAPSPLRGPNIEELGLRFPDMTDMYTKKVREFAMEKAKELNIPVQEGVYMFTEGPMYETPAEIRMLQNLGVDAVGMSTVPEVVAARHCKMNILGISCITNMAAGITGQILTHQEVFDTAKEASEKFTLFITEIVKGWKN